MSRSSHNRHSGPTQKDIAKALGLAQSTVATALNPKTEHRLQAETAAQIKAYAKKVGYRHQRFAQIMRGGDTLTVGVVAQSDTHTNNHELIARLVGELNRSGYRQILVDPQWFDGNAEAVRNYLLDHAVEGVIFCNILPFSGAETLRASLPPSLPIVSLCSSSLPGIPDIRVDTHTAFYHLTRYHLEIGARRLACLAKYRDPSALWRPDWSIRERITGFTQAIQQSGGIVLADEITQELLELPAHVRAPVGFSGVVGEIVFPVRPSRVTNAYENGFYQTLRLLERNDRPDSLICMNDDTALGALAACADHGIAAPDEIRISGYDDTDAGRFGMLPLTTVQKPLDDLVRKAVEMILARIRKPEAEVESHLLPGKVILRRSTGTPEAHWRLQEQGSLASGGTGASFEFLPETDRLLRFKAHQPDNAISQR